MVDEQTKRAIETMAQCGSDVDALAAMFPAVDKNDIKTIWQYTYDAMHYEADGDNDDSGSSGISINCS